ncbi:MAG: hypothetical protein OXS47_11705 [Chloroflexota bacterium]|nr:hypothetical protein [Chloroflexota bacterium]
MRLIHLAALGVALTVILMTVASSAAQDGGEDEAREAMVDFLSAWIYSGDAEQTKSYFSESSQSAQLAPDPVRVAHGHDLSALPNGYWDFINGVWQPETHWRTGQDDLAIITSVGGSLVQTFEDEFNVNVISSAEDSFLAFEASNDMSIYTFDAANKGAASVLRDSGRRTLGMLADIPTKENAGPFVAFWQAEDDGQWRIQMVGAIRP